jgi:hypothetical protein
MRIEEVKSTERYGTNVPGVTRTVHTVTVTFRVEGCTDAASAADLIVSQFRKVR